LNFSVSSNQVLWNLPVEIFLIRQMIKLNLISWHYRCSNHFHCGLFICQTRISFSFVFYMILTSTKKYRMIVTSSLHTTSQIFSPWDAIRFLTVNVLIVNIVKTWLNIKYHVCWCRGTKIIDRRRKKRRKDNEQHIPPRRSTINSWSSNLREIFKKTDGCSVYTKFRQRWGHRRRRSPKEVVRACVPPTMYSAGTFRAHNNGPRWWNGAHDI